MKATWLAKPPLTVKALPPGTRAPVGFEKVGIANQAGVRSRRALESADTGRPEAS